MPSRHKLRRQVVSPITHYPLPRRGDFSLHPRGVSHPRRFGEISLTSSRKSEF
ncbi:hypothetical protein [Fischerella thermalis]|uniref:hypothetical protein n=1 Tax=Fischerella thermalis TaxID=372787 RepID=UPI0015E13EEA|nr:hypothetical protein [Fischerella thermalis]